MKNWITGFVVAVGLAAVPLVTMTASDVTAYAQTASKQIVDKAKDNGLIGETRGGYLMARVDISAEVRAAMNDINIKRKSLYTRTAREKNESVEDIATLSGEEQIERAKAGHYVLGQSGKWEQK